MTAINHNSSGLKIKTSVKAGGMTAINHNAVALAL
jgi:hypothetical protein